MPRYEGRLELTWTNKDQSLLAHEDSSYEWLSPSDYRVAEVRLLEDGPTVGAVSKVRSQDNLLIEGDALHALTALAKVPEFRRQYAGRVKLAYLDPPFNTGQAFGDHYDDALEHSVWLTMMRDRLVQIEALLSDNGSVWVHCDDAEQHRLRLVMDEVFGNNCYVATVVWRSSDNSNNDAKQLSTDHNYIVVYSKSQGWESERLRATPDQVSHYRNPDNDPEGPWFDGNPLNSPNPRENLRFHIESPTGYMIPPPPNGWRWSPETVQDRIATGEIRFTPDGRNIRRRTYLKDHAGLPASSLWVDLEDTGHNRQAKAELKRLFPDLSTAELFATPKPERLLRKILRIATLPGDIVLDPFVGSGTTAAVAHKMDRRWVAIERQPETIRRFTFPRLKAVVEGKDPGGITTLEVPVAQTLPEGLKSGDARRAASTLSAALRADVFQGAADVDAKAVAAIAKALRALDKTETETVWDRGGGFRLLRVAQSMFEVDAGMVFLADNMTNGRLAEATAAQLGFAYEVDPPFVGSKGRARLAVVDGVVNEGVVKLLVVALAEGERVVVCGTGIDPEARQLLKDLAPGSTLRKIPSALLDRYRASAQAMEPRS